MQLDERQSNALEAAREAIRHLCARVKAKGGPPVDIIRTDLGLGKGTTYDRNFRSGSDSNFAVISKNVIAALNAWQANTELAYVVHIIACTASLEIAIDRVNDFRVSIGKEPIDVRTTINRYEPFELINETSSLFTAPNTVLPVPVYGDYVSSNNKVPVLAKHDDIYDRLEKVRFCHVRGIASCGKTIAALNTAFRYLNRHQFKALYVDLGVHADPPSLVRAMFQIVKDGERALIIIDNAHRQPELLVMLKKEWERANDRPRLHIIVGTTISASRVRRGLLLEWPSDTIELAADKDLFGGIATFLVKKFTGATVHPGDLQQETWHRIFGGHLHAFSFAVLDSLDALKDLRWSLSKRQAYHWINHNWLHRQIRGQAEPISKHEHQDLDCISVFGAQQLEVAVPENILPSDSHSPFLYLRTLGIVREVKPVGLVAGASRYRLMEPGWGELILAAGHVSEEDQRDILAKTLRRSPAFARTVSMRFPSDDPMQRTLVGDLIRDEQWLTSLSKTGLSTIIHWLSVLTEHSPSGKNVLLAALCQEIRRDNGTDGIISGTAIGQVIKLFSQFDKHRLRGEILEALSGVAPDAESRFITSLSSTPPDEIATLARHLITGSPLHAAVARATAEGLDAQIASALPKGLTALGNLLRAIKALDGDQFATALDILSRYRAQLHGMIRGAPFVAMRPFSDLASVNGEIDDRMLGLFFSMFNTDYWRALQPVPDAHFVGAPWLVRSLRYFGKGAFATLLADALTARVLESDLTPPGGQANRKIEMIGEVGRSCSDPETYLRQMRPVIARDVAKSGIYGGIIADGLQTVADIEGCNVAAAIDDPSFETRLDYQFGDISNKDGHDRPNNFVRLLGAYASLFDMKRFERGMIDFRRSVRDDQITGARSIRPSEGIDHLQHQQVQFWRGLWALSRVSGLPLIKPPVGVIDEVLRRFRVNLDYSTAGEKSAIADMRTQVMIDWLEKCARDGGGALVPGTGQLHLS